jgi:flagellar biosynthetic protein FlhB
VSKHDKTEAPTPKKKKDARKKGNVARSPELVSWGGLLVASFVVPLAFGAAADRVVDLLHEAAAAMEHPEPSVAVHVLGDGARAAVLAIAPLAAAMVAWALVANLAQTRGAVATDRLKPKLERINPFKGVKRLLSPQGLWQAGKVLIKSALLAAVAFGPLSDTTQRLTGGARLSLTGSVLTVADTAVHVVRTVALLGLLLGALDYAIAHRRVVSGLKMTKQEVKDEYRNTEGDPLVKGQIRQRAREMSRNRMIAAVGDASVVVVNPTHVAVALRYEQAGGAPVVVAKGKGVLADRIRAEARTHNVPLVRDVDLAWSLHGSCRIGDAIPTELYEAVAKILAFVLTVAKRSAIGGVLSLPAGSAPAR